MQCMSHIMFVLWKPEHEAPQRYTPVSRVPLRDLKVHYIECLAIRKPYLCKWKCWNINKTTKKGQVVLLQGFPAKLQSQTLQFKYYSYSHIGMEKSWGEWVTCIVIEIVWWQFGKLPMASLIWKSNIPQEHLFRIISNWIKNSLCAFCRIFLWSIIFENYFFLFLNFFDGGGV